MCTFKQKKAMKNKVFFISLFFLTSIFYSCDEGYNYYPNEDGFYSEGTENYNEIVENPFILTSDQNISTFSIDVDGGSFANCRRFINNGQLPPANAIRTEEFINYFKYNYGEPDDGLPFYHSAEIAGCPWVTNHKLLRISFKGKTIACNERLGTNFVFLIDVSGSMDSDDKLKLLKDCFANFVQTKIDNRDFVSIVTYAGSSKIVLEPTSGSDQNKIIRKINNLSSGGSTAGADGIITAYELAQQNFITNGNNRIILATDGDFNVGISSQDELINLIEDKRDLGVFLTVLGVGTGNLNEGTMEQLADHGNGNYEYIDSYDEGVKVFINEFNSFYPVAKDVKLQVEFDSLVVKSYRLIGYENRILSNDDFENDSTDAGDLGADQDVTALYELVLQNDATINQKALTVKVRYKTPTNNNSQVFSLDVENSNTSFDNATENLRFAAAVSAFAMILRNSEYIGTTNYDDVISWIQDASSYNPFNYKTELLGLIDLVKNIQ